MLLGIHGSQAAACCAYWNASLRSQVQEKRERLAREAARRLAEEIADAAKYAAHAQERLRATAVCGRWPSVLYSPGLSLEHLLTSCADL